VDGDINGKAEKKTDWINPDKYAIDLPPIPPPPPKPEITFIDPLEKWDIGVRQGEHLRQICGVDGT
jgi:hypothetical protein